MAVMLFRDGTVACKACHQQEFGPLQTLVEYQYSSPIGTTHSQYHDSKDSVYGLAETVKKHKIFIK